MLNAEERHENAKHSYVPADDGMNLAGTVVIIVDDIVTTGASIGACAELARQANARAVIGLVCARAESRRGIDENNYIILGE